MLYLDSLYASLFFENGNAWDFGETQNCSQNATGQKDCGNGNMFLQDVGAELRLKAFLFNDFNEWNSVFRVAYGLQDNEDFGFAANGLPIRFYIGIGTDF